MKIRLYREPRFTLDTDRGVLMVSAANIYVELPIIKAEEIGQVEKKPGETFEDWGKKKPPRKLLYIDNTNEKK